MQGETQSSRVGCFEFCVESACNSYGLLCPVHEGSKCSEFGKICSVVNVTAKFAQIKAFKLEARSGNFPFCKCHQQERAEPIPLI